MSQGRTAEAQILLVLTQCLREGVITKEEYFQQQRELLSKPFRRSDEHSQSAETARLN